MNSSKIFWLDLSTTAAVNEVPSFLDERFVIQSFKTMEALQLTLNAEEPACIFVDFDYPDRRRLAQFAVIKNQFPKVPIVMLTVQHSESLAIWAFRHSALDYLVKPVKDFELINCVERIRNIWKLKESQNDRFANTNKPPIPHDIPNSSSSLEDRLGPAVFFVQQNFSQSIYSDAMARLCGMSAAHFSRVFKKRYGLTFQEFLLRYRVREGCKLLHGPATNIADIAYSVGFSDPSYFARVFKRFMGSAPSEYSADMEGLAIEGVANGEFDDPMNSSSQIVRRLSGTFEQ
jgi:AraC-like DNA-binding protein